MTKKRKKSKRPLTPGRNLVQYLRADKSRKKAKKILTPQERGSMGGKRAAERMSAKKRTERARKGGKAKAALARKLVRQG